MYIRIGKPQEIIFDTTYISCDYRIRPSVHCVWCTCSCESGVGLLSNELKIGISVAVVMFVVLVVVSVVVVLLCVRRRRRIIAGAHDFFYRAPAQHSHVERNADIAIACVRLSCLSV